MMAHMGHHLAIDYSDADDLANAVQDALGERIERNTSPQEVARSSYDVVMELLGHGDDDE
jgi:hypothetical protein